MKKYLIILAIVLLAAACSKKPVATQPAPIQNQPTPTSTPPDAATGWNSYTSPDKNGFSIKYSSDFGFSTDINKVRGLAYIPVCDENMRACAYISRDKYPGTNFDGAGLSVNIDSTLTSEARCYNFKVATNSAQNQMADVTINGVVFKSATGGDAGAGHSEQLQVYRNFHNNKCFEISQHIGSTNIDNYPPGKVTQFNTNEVTQKLQGVVNTFEFTIVKSGEVNNQKIFANLGEPTTLKMDQVVYFKNADVSLKLTGLINSPCPKEAQCFWSGLNVGFELTTAGKVYHEAELSDINGKTPYYVSLQDTDYKTYASLVVSKR